MTRKFGGRLYQMFFRSCTEKVWGMPCRDISADWAAQRSKGLSLTKAASAALRPARRTPEPDGEERADVIKTLITSFRYPRHGPGMLWEAAAARIQERGGRVHMGTRVNGLERTGDGRWRVTLESGDGAERQREVDQLISSAPLGWLVNHLRPTLPTAAREAASALRYRDFLTVALILKTPSRFPDNWLYIHDPQLQVGRIQNFGNWSPEMRADRPLHGLLLDGVLLQQQRRSLEQQRCRIDRDGNPRTAQLGAGRGRGCDRWSRGASAQGLPCV